MSEKKERRKKKIFIIPIAILACLVLAGVAIKVSGIEFGSGAEIGYPVNVGTAEQMDLRQEVSVKGTVVASDQADVASSSNYKISEILVEEGDIVTEGQILARLEADDLENSYSKARLALSEAKREHDSAKLLYEEGAVSKSEYLKAKSAYEEAALTLNSFDIADKTTVKSPIKGTVTRVNVTLGRYASETENNQPMFVIENLESLQMKVKISEYDISSIKVGQTATISAEVLGDQTVQGIVSKISPTGEQKETGSKEMVIPVTIDIDKGTSALIAGVTAKATILIAEKTSVLTVPIDAILEDPETGESFVFTVKENVLSKTAVTPGLEGNLYLEVTSDELKAGDRIVLSPSFELTDGMTVTITNAPEGGVPVNE